MKPLVTYCVTGVSIEAGDVGRRIFSRNEDMLEPYETMIMVGALLASAFFSGIEMAFLASDKLNMQLEAERKTLSGKLLNRFLIHPDRFICTTLIGSTIALIIYSTYAAKMLIPCLQTHLPEAVNNPGTVFILQTILSALGVLVVGEFIPKSIFLLGPNRLLALFTLPTAVMAYVLQPLVTAVTAIARSFVSRALGQPTSEGQPTFDLKDLHSFIQNTLSIEGKTPARVSANIVRNLIEFKETRVRDCMVPKAAIVAIQLEGGTGALRQTAIQSGHSKVLVYENDIDDIIGYCHADQLLGYPKHLKEILTPVVKVSATSLASEVLIQLTTAKDSLALVVDELGGTVGVISTTDIIAEIVGEIQEEHDKATLIDEK